MRLPIDRNLIVARRDLYRIGQVNRRRGGPGNRGRRRAERRDTRRLEKDLRTGSGQGRRLGPIFCRGRGQRNRKRDRWVLRARNFQDLICRSAGRRMDRHRDPNRGRAFRHLRVARVRCQLDGAFREPGFNMGWQRVDDTEQPAIFQPLNPGQLVRRESNALSSRFGFGSDVRRMALGSRHRFASEREQISRDVTHKAMRTPDPRSAKDSKAPADHQISTFGDRQSSGPAMQDKLKELRLEAKPHVYAENHSAPKRWHPREAQKRPSSGNARAFK